MRAPTLRARLHALSAPLALALAVTLGAPLAAPSSLSTAQAKAKAKRPDRRPTVAVLYFDYTGKTEALGVLRKGLAAMLISDLSGEDRYRLVERDRLQSILDELKLTKSGAVDKAAAAKVGKLLGARYLVLGSYFDLLGSLRADARVVEVETGRIVQSFGATGKPDDFLSLEQGLAERLRGLLTEALPPLPKRPAVRKRPRRPKRLRTRTAVRYAKALEAKDKGDKAEAKAELEVVGKEQPDVQLAAADLAAIVR